MQLSEALAVARRAWIIIAVCVAVGLGLAVIRASQTSASHVSSVQIFLAGNATSERDEADTAMVSAQRVPSYIELLKANELTERVSERLGRTLAPGELAAKVQTQLTTNTVVLNLTVTDPVADEAERMAEAVAEELSLLIEDLETPDDATDPLVSARVVGSPSPATTAPVTSTRTLGLGGLLGLLAGFGLAVLWDRFRSRNRGHTTTD